MATIQHIKDIRSPLLSKKTRTEDPNDFHRIVAIKDDNGKTIKKVWATNSQLTEMATLKEGKWIAKEGYRYDEEKLFVVDDSKGEKEETGEKEEKETGEEKEVTTQKQSFLATPKAAELIDSQRIDVSQVVGTGKGSRITKSDLAKAGLID